MNLQTRTVTYFPCPKCGHELPVDHLIRDMDYPQDLQLGCKCGWTTYFRWNGSCAAEPVTVTDVHQSFVRALDVLQHHKDHSLRLLVRSHHYRWREDDNRDDRTNDSPFEPNAYWYDEHTCLTNWVHDVATVVDGNDTDPHGLFQYVRSFPVADGTDAAMDAAVKAAEQRIIERWTSDEDREADDKEEA